MGDYPAAFSTVSFDTVTFRPATDTTPAMLVIEPDGPGANSASIAFNLSELHEFVAWLHEVADV